MKRGPEPASVEDVSEETNSTIPETRRTASHSGTPRTTKRQKMEQELDRSRTKSAAAAVICHSLPPVSLSEAVRKHDGSWPMTILSGCSDRVLENEDLEGHLLRRLVYEDRPTSNETMTFIERDIVMTKEDAERRDPVLWIEQRTFEYGKEVIKARQLLILGRVVDGNVYIFKECGDQIAGVEKLPDLHLTARILPPAKWREYLNEKAQYYGYEREIVIRPDQEDLKRGKHMRFKLEPHPAGLDSLCFNLEVSSKRLPGQSSLGQDLHVFTINLKGLGALIEDTGVRSDVKLKICVE